MESNGLSKPEPVKGLTPDALWETEVAFVQYPGKAEEKSLINCAHPRAIFVEELAA